MFRPILEEDWQEVTHRRRGWRIPMASDRQGPLSGIKVGSKGMHASLDQLSTSEDLPRAHVTPSHQLLQATSCSKEIHKTQDVHKLMQLPRLL